MMIQFRFNLRIVLRVMFHTFRTLLARCGSLEASKHAAVPYLPYVPYLFGSHIHTCAHTHARTRTHARVIYSSFLVWKVWKVWNSLVFKGFQASIRCKLGVEGMEL